jgi:hypothetical protein
MRNAGSDPREGLGSFPGTGTWPQAEWGEWRAKRRQGLTEREARAKQRGVVVSHPLRKCAGWMWQPAFVEMAPSGSQRRWASCANCSTWNNLYRYTYFLIFRRVKRICCKSHGLSYQELRMIRAFWIGAARMASTFVYAMTPPVRRMATKWVWTAINFGNNSKNSRGIVKSDGVVVSTSLLKLDRVRAALEFGTHLRSGGWSTRLEGQRC